MRLLSHGCPWHRQPVDELTPLFAKLRRLLRSRGRSIDDADDLIQDAFVRLTVYCKANKVEKTEAFLVRTALNLLVDQRIREQRTPIDSVDLDTLSLIDPAPSLDAVYGGEKRLLHWQAGLRAMSPRRREVFLLNRLDGYSFPQIADKLQISLSMVEKHCAKAALFLTDWMEDE
jgi:RNA polymerase sigma factor (sigma-70 family)